MCQIQGYTLHLAALVTLPASFRLQSFHYRAVDYSLPGEAFAPLSALPPRPATIARLPNSILSIDHAHGFLLVFGGTEEVYAETRFIASPNETASVRVRVFRRSSRHTYRVTFLQTLSGDREANVVQKSGVVDDFGNQDQRGSRRGKQCREQCPANKKSTPEAICLHRPFLPTVLLAALVDQDGQGSRARLRGRRLPTDPRPD